MSSEKIQNLTSDSFDSVVADSSKPVLVDFWAPWCGPCKAIAPILEELAEEMDQKVDICKVDVDNNAEIAGKFNIRAIPTILIFKNGEVADQVVGMTSKGDLQSKLEALAS
ncbi:thioredoxin [Rubellicoccus peritrichatus]|uniref:Thioredoxin n=1 Tax=Rubellicoccus peritrichatus TaxID=3080537 RepID=A0AAQ3L950_9BACT|nr:thioredoxin [Puniceicoccus sp. CR14]WOO41645.1 thioredoxin [Puniceicoccus sp. CR14]